MKTIGVLGGLGPQATMDFEARIHVASRAATPPLRSGRYPPMVVYYYRHPPFALGPGLQPELPLRPHPKLLAAAGRFAGWADVLVVAANAPHLFLDQIERAFGGPVLNMTELAADEAARLGWRTVGVVGLGEPRVYFGPLADRGLDVVTPPATDQTRLDRAIFALMEGRAQEDDQCAARDAVESLRGRGTDGVILGCTEVPLLLGVAAQSPSLINPAQLLADAAVRFAMAE